MRYSLLLVSTLMSFPVYSEHLFADGFEAEEVVTPEPPCYPLLSRIVTWDSQWSAPNRRYIATYPDSIGYPVPLGADRTIPRAVRWTPVGGEVIRIRYDSAQANPVVGYNSPRPALNVTLAISECPGWFDVTPGCTTSGTAGGLTWLTTHSSSNVCVLDAGKTYYLNVRVECPDGVPNSTFGCDVLATHRSVQ